MDNAKPKKDKWYTLKPRILEMSSRQIGFMALFPLFLIIIFLVLSLYIPQESRYTFLKDTMPPLIGFFLAAGGAWIYRRFKPAPTGFQGYSRRRYIRESLYGAVILVVVIGLWVLFFNLGYANTAIAIVFAGFGAVLLLAALLVSIVLNLRDKRTRSAADSTESE